MVVDDPLIRPYFLGETWHFFWKGNKKHMEKTKQHMISSTVLQTIIFVGGFS